MNDNQKERLLKLAENNPELAKDVVEIFKEESNKSEAPVAVKIVKNEDDKLEITEEQKKYAVYLLWTEILGGGLILVLFLTAIFSKGFPVFVVIKIFITAILIAGLSWYFSIKAGLPVVKQLFSKHFKFVK